MVLPKLVDRLVTVPGLGQRVVPGLAQHLVAAVGSNWDDGEARYEGKWVSGERHGVGADYVHERVELALLLEGELERVAGGAGLPDAKKAKNALAADLAEMEEQIGRGYSGFVYQAKALRVELGMDVTSDEE